MTMHKASPFDGMTTEQAGQALSTVTLRETYTQAAHGFAVGDVFRRSSGSYVKACADSAANAAALGVVSVLGAGDWDSNTKLMMHLNGANGSTTFTDEIGHTFSIEDGSPIITTAEAKFGGACGDLYQLGGANMGNISASAGSEFIFTGDFTIEFWAKRQATGPNGTAIRASSTTSTVWKAWFYYGQIGFDWIGGGTNYFTAAIDDANWHHWCVMRSGSTVYGFKDGVVDGTTFTKSGTIGTEVDTIRIGSVVADDGNLPCWLDEMRVSTNARYSTSGFTPQTGEFAPASNSFTAVKAGDVSTLSGLTDGAAYYLSQATPGLLTASRPGSGVARHILDATGTATGNVQIYGEVP